MRGFHYFRPAAVALFALMPAVSRAQHEAHHAEETPPHPARHVESGGHSSPSCSA